MSLGLLGFTTGLRLKKLRYAKENEQAYAAAFAIYSEDDNSLYFYKNKDYKKVKAASNSGAAFMYRGRTVTGFYEGFEEETKDASPPWSNIAISVVRVKFIDKIAPFRTTYWFRDFENLAEIDLRNLDTSNVTDMGRMFYDCFALVQLDLSTFDTHNVTNLGAIFYKCTSLEYVDVTSFDTSNVVDMQHMFSYCSKLKEIDVSGFDTSNVTNMNCMFQMCSDLSELNVSNFDTSKVTNMGYMFNVCETLETLDLRNFDTNNATNMRYMFQACQKLTSLDLSNFNTSNVDNTTKMFNGCGALTTIYVSDLWDMSAVTTSTGMFASCVALVGENSTAFDSNYIDKTYACVDTTSTPGYLTYKPMHFAIYSDTDSSLTFYNNFDGKYSSITSGGTYNGKTVSGLYTGFDKKNITGYSTLPWASIRASVTKAIVAEKVKPLCAKYWFYGFTAMTSADLSKLDTSAIDSMYYMFYNCKALTALDVGSFDTTKVTSMYYTFSYCSALTSLDLSGFDTSKVTTMRGMFSGCSGLKNLDLSGFDTSNVTNMYYMFNGCSSLVTLDVSNFNTSRVTTMYRMFYGCSALSALDISSFDTSKVTNMYYMFYGCSSLTTVIASGLWNTDAVTSSNGMFTNCSLIKGENGTGYNSSYLDKTYARIDASGTPGYFTSALKAFAIYSADDNSLVFYSNENGDYDSVVVGGTYNGKVVTKVYTGFDSVVYTSASEVPWADKAATIVSVSFEGVVKPKSTSRWFLNFSSLTQIDLANLDTVNTVNMGWMFSGCSALSEVDVSHFKTQNATIMTAMFQTCTSLTFVDVSNFDTSNVTDFRAMFNGCESITELDVSNFNTKKVTSLYTLFQGCKKITVLDLSSFNTSAVTDSQGVFNSCRELTTIYVSNLWDMSSVTSSGQMFGYCENLVGQNGTKNSGGYSNEDKRYAYIDTVFTPGYFTYKAHSSEYAFAVYSADDNSLTFYNNDEYSSITVGGTYKSKAVTGVYDGFTTANYNTLPWNDYLTSIKTVVFANIVRPVSTQAWFQGCTNLTSINLIKLDTRNTTNMWGTFNNCSSLTSLDLRGFDTSKVTNMANMFNGCSSLTTLDISSFDTSNVSYWVWMFYNCSSLAKLDVSKFNTSKATSMYALFCKCSSVTELDVSNFDTSNVTSMQAMFEGCSAVTTLDVSGFNTAKVTSMYQMFRDCNALTSLDVSNFDTRNVTNIQSMFYNCYALTTIGVSNFNTSKVTNMGWMFYNCNKLSEVYLGSFDTSNVTNMKSMFCYCKALTKLYLGSFYTSKVTDMSHMLRECTSLTTVYVSSRWSTSAVTTSDSMFYGSTKLKGENGTAYSNSYTNVTYARRDTSSQKGYFTYKATLSATPFAVYSATDNSLTFYNSIAYTEMNIVGKPSSYKGKAATNYYQGFTTTEYSVATAAPWYSHRGDITSVTFAENISPISTANWFYEFSVLNEIDLSNLNTGSVTNMNRMFYGCSALKVLDVSKLGTGNVTDMSCMFYGCSALTKLDLSSFSTGVVTTMRSMFNKCSALTSLVIDTFSTGNVTDMRGMFYGCKSLLAIDISNFGTGRVTNMESMFSGCDSLKTIYVSDLWDTSSVTDSFNMFVGDAKLAGGNGTRFDSDNVGIERACIDTESTPGYFTHEGTAFAIYSADDNSLVFYNRSISDNENVSVGSTYNGRTVTEIYTGFENVVYQLESLPPWSAISTSITSASFADVIRPLSTAWWFYNCNSITDIDLNKLDTKNSISMRYMFGLCKSLTSVDVSGLDTGNVTDMRGIFRECTALASVDLSSFDTHSATDMQQMFYGCTALARVNLNNFDTRRVVNMTGMFYDCPDLESIDLRGFNTNNVTSMRFMFYNCKSLTRLDLSSFDTSKVTDMYRLFYDCSYLVAIFVSDLWSTASATNSTNMFYGCSRIKGGNGTVYNSSYTDKTYARLDTSSAPGYFMTVLKENCALNLFTYPNFNGAPSDIAWQNLNVGYGSVSVGSSYGLNGSGVQLACTSVNSSGGTTYSTTAQIDITNAIPGHIYYVLVAACAAYNASNKPYIQAGIANKGVISSTSGPRWIRKWSTQISTASYAWSRYSFYVSATQQEIENATSNGGIVALALNVYLDSTNNTMKVDDLLVIDLTEEFGAGNEPTQAECNTMFFGYNSDLQYYEYTKA